VTNSSFWPQIGTKLGWVVSDYSIQAGDLESANPPVNVYRYQYESASRDVTGRGFLGVGRRIRRLTDGSATPTVFETEILDYDHSIFGRICRSEVKCAYPSIDVPVARLTIAPIDASKYRVRAWRTSRTVQARAGLDAGYDLKADSVVQDVCDLDDAPQSTAGPCSISNELISSIRQTREFDAFGNVVRSVREISNGGSLMSPVAPPSFYEELRAVPEPLSVFDQARWLTSRYKNWQYTSFDPTIPPAEQTIRQRITKAYEPNSIEVSSTSIIC
jgi:hypothetical protein